MKTKEFKYVKKNGEEGEYNLLILNESTDYLKGIDLNKLNEKEKKDLTAIMERYEEELKPFMKAFRQFIVENIVDENTKK